MVVARPLHMQDRHLSRRRAGQCCLISCLHRLGLCSAPRNPGPMQPGAPRGQHRLPAPALATCVFAVFRLCPCASGPGRLSRGSKCTCRRSWPFTSARSRKQRCSGGRLPLFQIILPPPVCSYFPCKFQSTLSHSVSPDEASQR